MEASMTADDWTERARDAAYSGEANEAVKCLIIAVTLLSRATPPITEPATKADLSAAQAPASTAEPTPQSLPLDRTTTDDGPAALCSTSVNGHQWVVPWAKDNGVIHEPRGWCQRCGALLLFDRIVVPDARQVWSILVKQDIV